MLADEAAHLRQQILRSALEKEQAAAEESQWRARLVQRAEAAEELADAERARREALDTQYHEERLLHVRAVEADAARLQEAIDALLASRSREQSAAAREAEALAAAHAASEEKCQALNRLQLFAEREAAEKGMWQTRIMALYEETSSAEKAGRESLEDVASLVQECKVLLERTYRKVVYASSHSTLF